MGVQWPLWGTGVLSPIFASLAIAVPFHMLWVFLLLRVAGTAVGRVSGLSWPLVWLEELM